MPSDSWEYDVFLSYATEDREWWKALLRCFAIEESASGSMYRRSNRAITFSTNTDRRLFTQLKDDTFLYLYSFGPGAWLALLPDSRFDASPEGMCYLCCTEIGTLYSYTAEELQKEFYSPSAVRQVLESYSK